MKKRTMELKYLFLVLTSLGIGFFLLHQHLLRKAFPLLAGSASGKMTDLGPYVLAPFPNGIAFALFAGLFLLAHFYLRSAVPEGDPYILPVLAFISGIGFIMILRLAPDLAVLRGDALRHLSAAGHAARVTDNVRTLAQLGMGHLVNLCVGMLAFLLTIRLFNKRFFAWISGRRYIWIGASTILFLGTWLFGATINGKKLWLFGFQPVELVKLLVLFFVAGYLYNEGKGITFHGKGKFLTWCGYTIPFAAVSLLAFGPTILQGDYGGAVLLFAVCFIMLHLAGNKVYITLLAASSLALIAWLCYTLNFPQVLKTRIDMFLDPFGRGEAMTTVLWSISTGGIFGNGIGFGLAHRIPEVQSDFNFAAICEEMGLLGGLSLMAAYAVLLMRLFKASLTNHNIYKRILVIAIALMIALQSFIILAGNLNGIPLTGITLPFCSYGGSSIVVSFIMAGIGIKISGEER
ncbi:MAG TPA: FtsW/RodA/SpoVE family cell cycle protein [Syntrophorhabdaceae bacterium]